MACDGNVGHSSEKTVTQTPESSTDLTSNLISRAALRYDFQNMMPKQDMIKLNSVSTGIPLFVVHPIEGTPSHTSHHINIKILLHMAIDISQ